MPFPIMLALAGAQMFSQAQKEKRDKKLAAATQAYSPWTGMKANPIEYADPIGTGMKAYGAHVADEQATEGMDSNKKLLEAQTRYFNNMSQSNSPMMSGPQQGSNLDYGMSPWWYNQGRN